MTRDDDFRASGSGHNLYENRYFDDKIIQMSFNLARKLKSQSTAIDYVCQKVTPLILEISYGFIKELYESCV